MEENKYYIPDEVTFTKGALSFQSDFQLTILEDHVYEFEDVLRKKEKISRRKLHKRLSTIFDSDQQLFFTDMISEEMSILNLHRKYFYYSVVILLYTIIEESLEKICFHLKHLMCLKLSTNDLKGSGIERSKNYIIKCCGLNFPRDTHEWRMIKNLAKIRHCIVHAGGNIQDVRNPSKLEEIIDNLNGIYIKNNSIHIEKKFILEFISLTKEFLGNVYDQCFCFQVDKRGVTLV